MQRFWNYARLLSTGAPVPFATVTVYQAGSTLNLATIYADNQSPPTPLTNPFKADANGYFFFYSADGLFDVRLSAGIPPIIPTPYTWGAVQVASVAGGIFDVKQYGAVGDFVHDDTLSIQAAINAAVTAGGGMVWVPQGHYRLTSALVLNMGNGTVGIQVCGASQQACILEQTVAGHDILQLGATGASVANYIHISDLTLSGGSGILARYGLNLNNCLSCVFDRLYLQTCQVGVYGQGQNESHTFRDIVCDTCNTGGMYFGATNGGAGNVLDYPILQKSVFTKIRISQTLNGTALTITAGVLTNQQESGNNTLQAVRLEGNFGHGILIDFSSSTTIDNLSNEDRARAANVNSALIIASSVLYLNNAELNDSQNGNRYAYTVQVLSGNLFATNSTIEPSLNGSIFVVGSVIRIVNCYLDLATIVYNTTTDQLAAEIIGVTLGDNTPQQGRLVPGDGSKSAGTTINGLSLDGGEANTIDNDVRDLGLTVAPTGGIGARRGIRITTGTASVQFDAPIYASSGTAMFDGAGNITSSSDERLKTGLRRFSRGLFATLQLRPILFRWTPASGLESTATQVGFGAARVRRVIPETIGVRPDGYLTLSDRGILGALVNSVQTLTWTLIGLGLVVAWLAWRG